MNDQFIGKVYSLDDTKNTFNFRGYDIPIHLMKLTGGGADTFERIAIEHLKILSELVGLSSDHFVLEVGCGIGRDAIPLTEIISSRGGYMGIDIYEKSIDWCEKNISIRNPQFNFKFWDIKDAWFNPGGLKKLDDFKIDKPELSVDRIFLQSVFTHLTELDVRHYFSEFSKILKNDGKVYATFFIVDEEIIASQTSNSYITFNHQICPGVWVHDLSEPAIAVGYTLDALEKMAKDCGLIIDKIVYGCWSGRGGELLGGQDSVVLVKQK
jgi:cyclopropane fatty-acyl-phospholipid synthase-like methyltransferase